MTKVLFILIFSLSLSRVFAQTPTTANYAVQVSATVQESPALITLNWVADPNATSYALYRKLKSASTWGSIYVTLAGSKTQFLDSNVVAGISYEYKFQKIASAYTGYGYINSGIKIPETECRGRMILIVDSTYMNTFLPELKRLEQDLTGDGWVVIRHDVKRTDPVVTIKNLIKSDYTADPTNTKAVFLFGHVPVPFSGAIAPDGHSDHFGAWPADVYYGEMDSAWTDVTVNNTSSPVQRTRNIPGDGKFDQSTIPSDVDLLVGRVDLSQLTSFPKSEATLLKNYLDKDHQYRHKHFSPTYRSLITDNFGVFSGEAFASNGWRNFSPLVGYSNIKDTVNYISPLKNGSYLWSYGCGPGSMTSCGGVCATADFVASNITPVFSSLFGSYFGDWDYPNNLLRAPLASGSTLVSFWAGRPHWQVHHMGLGETIGYSTRLSQNNDYGSLYISGSSPRGIHIALMGDPSLRMFMIAPPSALSATTAGTVNQVSWTASADAVIGYHLYRLDTISGCYNRINYAPITGVSYADSFPAAGNYYMLRALKMEVTPSGSFYNLSQGIFYPNQISIGIDELTNNSDVTIYPNPSNGKFTINVLKSKIHELEIYNLLGEKIMFVAAIPGGANSSSPGTPYRTVDISSHPKGIYFVKVTTEKGGVFLEKVLVQ